MLFFYRNSENTLVAASSRDEIPLYAKQAFVNRWDFKTFDDAKKIADELGEKYLAIDSGEWVSPRYDVIAMPQVGDDVSYAFNGDYYPCGKIIRITKTLQIVTSEGKRFTFKNGIWRYNKTWSLVKGHRFEKNPHF